MKLLSKYNRINIGITIIVFLLGSVCFYFVLRYILVNQLDETLQSERQEILQYVKAHQQLPDIENTREQWISFEQSEVQPAKAFMQSHYAFNQHKHEEEEVRQYIFSLQVAGNNYTVTVNKSQEETEDLLQIIILVTIAMIALILLANFIINRKVLGRLWNPFYTTIAHIKDYHLSGKPSLTLDKVSTDEFLLLNESLNEMALRINKDYDSLKRFTENAAHEMQTPLAVIRSKIELMLQTSELKQIQMQHLQEIEDATSKLAKLHQSLLMLTKLENNQFILNEQVDLKKIIEEKIAEKQDLFEAKKLKLTITLEETKVSFHQHLAEIMASNLLNNALRYTAAEGSVTITLTDSHFIICNTAANGSLDTGKVFQRFYKPGNKQEGTGLGLAIVKEICLTAGFSIEYVFANESHKFIVGFK